MKTLATVVSTVVAVFVLLAMAELVLDDSRNRTIRGEAVFVERVPPRIAEAPIREIRIASPRVITHRADLAAGSFGVSWLELMVVAGISGAMLSLPLALALAVWWYLRRHRRGDGTVALESQLIQDIHAGLSTLESRVESLETILLERGQAGRSV